MSTEKNPVHFMHLRNLQIVMHNINLDSAEPDDTNVPQGRLERLTAYGAAMTAHAYFTTRPDPVGGRTVAVRELVAPEGMKDGVYELAVACCNTAKGTTTTTVAVPEVEGHRQAGVKTITVPRHDLFCKKNGRDLALERLEAKDFMYSTIEASSLDEALMLIADEWRTGEQKVSFITDKTILVGEYFETFEGTEE